MKQIDWTVYSELQIPGSLTTGQEKMATPDEIDAINMLLREANTRLQLASFLLNCVRERKSEKS